METVLFKEVIQHDELEACLQFRIKWYMQSRVNKFLSKPDGVLWLDEYDPYSRHYIMYLPEHMGPLGYMRVIQKEKSHSAEAILYIANQNKIKLCSPKNMISIMDYFPGAKECIMNYIGNSIDNINICEPGRFVVDRSNTSASNTFRFVGWVLTQNINQASHAILSCVKSHIAFYHKCGFVELPGTTSCKLNEEMPEVSVMIKNL